jgi:hypothetical protein
MMKAIAKAASLPFELILSALTALAKLVYEIIMSRKN